VGVDFVSLGSFVGPMRSVPLVSFFLTGCGAFRISLRPFLSNFVRLVLPLPALRPFFPLMPFLYSLVGYLGT